MKTSAVLFILTAAVTASVTAQTPDVVNAQFETRAVSADALGDLHKLISSQAGPLWIGYAAASNRTDDDSCCWEEHGYGCHLESGNGSVGISRQMSNGSTRPKQPVQLEGSRTLFVLARVQDHAIGKIHSVSGGCSLDAGGLRLVWLTGVDTKASLAFLSEQVRDGVSKHQPDSALAAIAMHAGDEADRTLETMADPAQPEWLREKSLFWLASARGARGFQAVRRAAERDPSPQIREKTMFDFSISKEPAAIDELIRFASHDQDSKVRGQAIFWLSQKAGERAVHAIQTSIDNDPDTDVKKKAVFALQQLPKDEGIPLLIQVAKTNRNREVRKQAMFWLGQSGDPRALAFFQEVLKSN